jgi:hypothetical protein
MTQILVVIVLAGVGAYLVRRALRPAPSARGVDVSPLSTGWIAEHRRNDPR